MYGMLFCLNCWDVCGEDGSEGTAGSGLVEHYLKNDQADDICPKDQPLSVQEDCGSIPVFGNRI